MAGFRSILIGALAPPVKATPYRQFVYTAVLNIMAPGWRLLDRQAEIAAKISPAFPVGVLLFGLLWGSGSCTPMAQATPITSPPPSASSSALTTWPLLQSGDTGDAVRQLQSELSRLGVFDAPLDGEYGPNTEAAVRLFQQTQDLTPDGVVGPQTWQALALAQTSKVALEPLSWSGDDLLTFTPLTFAQPPPPPSPFWLVLMPLVPLIGGALTCLQRRLRGRQPINCPKAESSVQRRRKSRSPRP